MPRKPKRFRLLVVALTIITLLSMPVSKSDASKENPAPATGSLQAALNQLHSYITVNKSATAPVIYAGAYTLVDSVTNTQLIGHNADSVVPVASTTKMMTALVARATYNLSDVVTIQPQAEQIPETLVHFVPGEKITVQNLLQAMLIPSGNDAAYSLAYFYQEKQGISGAPDYKPFVEQMNQFAATHHLQNTHFADPAGLDDDGHSTATDLAVIARLVLTDPVLAAIVDTPSTTVASVDGSHTHALTNSNRLIQPTDSLYFPGVIGIKTGFTLGAGHCLVAGYNLNGRTLIGVVLNTTAFTATASAEEMRKLFVWANANVRVINY